MEVNSIDSQITLYVGELLKCRFWELKRKYILREILKDLLIKAEEDDQPAYIATKGMVLGIDPENNCIRVNSYLVSLELIESLFTDVPVNKPILIEKRNDVLMMREYNLLQVDN